MFLGLCTGLGAVVRGELIDGLFSCMSVFFSGFHGKIAQQSDVLRPVGTNFCPEIFTCRQLHVVSMFDESEIARAGITQAEIITLCFDPSVHLRQGIRPREVRSHPTVLLTLFPCVVDSFPMCLIVLIPTFPQNPSQLRFLILSSSTVVDVCPSSCRSMS